jgi:hypothetical protein
MTTMLGRELIKVEGCGGDQGPVRPRMPRGVLIDATANLKVHMAKSGHVSALSPHTAMNG